MRWHRDVQQGSLGATLPPRQAMVRYATEAAVVPDRARFEHRFERAVELTGSMRLHLHVKSEDADDLDLFVAIRKFDGAGSEVHFFGYNGSDRDVVAKGWLRASHSRAGS
jgi:hypothetical protein